MKKAILFFPLILLSVILCGQAPFPTRNEIKQFSDSKTCVVLEDNPFSSFNVYIKEAMKEYWIVTPYEFIEVTDLERKNSCSLSIANGTAGELKYEYCLLKIWDTLLKTIILT